MSSTEISIDRHTLGDALTRVAAAAAPRDPMRSGVHVSLADNRMNLTASNGEISIRATIPVTCTQEVAFVVPARLLVGIVKGAPEGDVTVTVEDDSAEVTTEGGKFSLPVIDPATFTRVTAPDGEPSSIEACTFAAAVHQVVHAASCDDSRPVLTGVLVTPIDDGLRLVTTDSYRLAVKDIDGATDLLGEEGAVIPAAALNTAMRALEGRETIEVAYDENRVSFSGGDIQVVLSLLAGDYPDYQRVLPKEHKGVFTVGAQQITADLVSAELVAGPTSTVTLSFDADGSAVHAHSELGTYEGVQCGSFQGDELTACFNAAFLREGVAAANATELRLEVSDAQKPAVLTNADDDSFRYVIMPVRQH